MKAQRAKEEQSTKNKEPRTRKPTCPSLHPSAFRFPLSAFPFPLSAFQLSIPRSGVENGSESWVSQLQLEPGVPESGIVAKVQ
jgi:hypothetical protein